MKFPPRQAEPLLDIMARFKSDQRKEKIDLGVGVLRDHIGKTPVLQCVKTAEKYLLKHQTTKSYVGLTGNKKYNELLASLFLNENLNNNLLFAQTPGGTGALYLAGQIIKKGNKNTTVYLPDPSYINHHGIIKAAGLKISKFSFYDKIQSKVDENSIINILKNAQPHDAIILQPSCNNPTGANYSQNKWDEIIELCKIKKIIPILDIAYIGLGLGFKDDSSVANKFIKECDITLTCLSCSKNFGLYRERTGMLIIGSNNETIRNDILGCAEIAARSSYSMPPDHGASVVELILASDELKNTWLKEVEFYKDLITNIRNKLSDKIPSLEFIRNQQGMFSMLPLNENQIKQMQEDFAIYMAPDARINIAGLQEKQIAYFSNAFNNISKST